MKNVKIVEVKSEIGAGSRGASMGVDALKIAAWDFGSRYFKTIESIEVPNENALLYEPVSNPHAIRINGVATMYERISETVKEVLESNTFPIVLSGDHSNAGGTIAGIKMAYPNKRLGVIWIDAHADMHSPFTTPSGNIHGMPLAISLGEDNREYAIRTPNEATIAGWERLKQIGGIAPKIKPSDLVLVGVRDTEAQENALIAKYNIPNITVEQVRNTSIDKASREILGQLTHCDLIYISFDVDSMDSAISKGTGTPVANGFTEKEAGDLVSRLIQNEKVWCFEITEINPTLDSENLMAENTFEILKKATNSII